ncbi:HEPN-associated N-terminal domain-containing protein [Marinobacter sp. M216]|uniref:HEPN-associated N-terminal domain-containing protein n=1 Tax=Marinobacter albus TaxID=3030833 RepID=A0ABT7HIL8_9GAMM|nr:HEPN-associated N-terminal domain-containing protein [Marinobacter sp. M216]MDK9559762.1 HEPN-associated N-terminal domain-containing protein [Marinobacter sp. M216]
MGRAKHEWIEAQERGWSAPETFVCSDCVGDGFLAEVVDANACETDCSYCGTSSAEAIAAPLDEIMVYVSAAFFQHYAEPAVAGLPRDSGDWVGENLITDTEDAFLSFGWLCNDDLLQDVCQSFVNDSWVQCANGHWLGSHEHERRHYAWSAFVEKTKHRTRYFFSDPNSTDAIVEDEYTPQQILKIIGQDIENFGLLKEVPAGTDLFRVREHASERCFETLEEMGPPPPNLASAGRMNPPGISYGYFAFQKSTAVLEVVGVPPTRLSIGAFQTTRPLLVVDLTFIPQPPSIFDTENKLTRDALIFMREFVASISEPVSKDGKQHIEYVPSQIVSEYLGQVLQTSDGRAIDAVIYRSTLNPGGINVVVFPPKKVFEGWDSLIRLVQIEKKTFSNWRAFDEFTRVNTP